MPNEKQNSESKPKILIVGGGFAGLECASGLAAAPVEITLADRHNYHLFQPLLYQVATAVLSPADIAAPIRRLLRNQANTRVVLAKLTGVDLQKKLAHFARGDRSVSGLIYGCFCNKCYWRSDVTRVLTSLTKCAIDWDRWSSTSAHSSR
jgi:NADH dehydrogenase